MSLKGLIEAECPQGCPPFEAQVWTLVRLDRDPELKERLLSGELNLLACQTCGALFAYDELVVVEDREAELLAFVFPSDGEGEAEKWRAKMAADFELMKQALGDLAPVAEPALYFGMESLREAMMREDFEAEEVAVARFIARTSGLETWELPFGAARDGHWPSSLFALPGAPDGRASVVAGLQKLLELNPALETYAGVLKRLQDDPKLEPPRARTKKAPGPSRRASSAKPPEAKKSKKR